MDHLSVLKRWTTDSANRACAPGRTAVLRSKTIEEAYQQYKNPTFFLFRIRKTSPELCYKAIENVFLKIQPVNEPELAEARNFALDRTATAETLTEYMNRITIKSKANQYLRAIFYLIRWRLDLQNNGMAFIVIKKLQDYLYQKNKATSKPLLMTYLKEIITFDAWLESIETCEKTPATNPEVTLPIPLVS